MEVCTAAFLLSMVIISSTSAPTSAPSTLATPTSTDSVIEDVKQAADLDFTFIKNDLQELQQTYANVISMNYQSSVEKLSEAINQTYKDDIPKNQSEYNLLCLEGIYTDVEDMMKDLNTAVGVCGNLSPSETKADRNIAQFKNITSSLGGFSQNLRNLINICIERFPKISWDRLECVFGQVNIVINQFNPVFDHFKMFNLAMKGHLMLLGIETSLCYQEALRQLTKINNNLLRDIDSCKEQTP